MPDSRWRLRLNTALLLIALAALSLAFGFLARENRRLRDALARAEARAVWSTALAEWSSLGQGGSGASWRRSTSERFWTARWSVAAGVEGEGVEDSGH